MLSAFSPSLRIRSFRSCCRSTHWLKVSQWHNLNWLIMRDFLLNGVNLFLLFNRFRDAAVRTFFGIAGNSPGILSVSTKPSKCLHRFTQLYIITKNTITIHLSLNLYPISFISQNTFIIIYIIINLFLGILSWFWRENKLFAM